MDNVVGAAYLAEVAAIAHFIQLAQLHLETLFIPALQIATASNDVTLRT
jgi:hypothetical protein